MLYYLKNPLMHKYFSFLFCSFMLNFVFSQNQPNDCINAITICGNQNFSSNVSGIGNFQEVTGCGGLEHNSIWLKINIAQSGTLGFNLIPTNTDLSIDYDFWVYGPNVTCAAKGSPIRCNTTNPLAAGLSNNITGMVGNTTITQSGPGANGNGFVRWLDVVVGQSYYIVIDRPIGNGGFEIQWTGTATTGTGAFPTPPTANNINTENKYKVCSSVSNIGVFDLNTVRSSINSNLADNEITFYQSFANAFDGINELPNIFSNSTNPQTIFAKVKNFTTECSSIMSFQLVVNPIPTATISINNTTICNGGSVTVTFNGTPNARIEYSKNSGSPQLALLNSSGTFSITENLTANTTYQLINVKSLDGSNNVICTNVLNSSVNVSVLPLPVATISGTATICNGGTSIISFNGTPNTLVTYNVNNGANQIITLDTTGNASLTTPVLNTTTTYSLVNVTYASTPFCDTNIVGNATITVVSNLSASIIGSDSICIGNNGSLAFVGTPDAIVSFTDGIINYSITLLSSGVVNFSTPSLTSNTTYSLISIELPSTPNCLQNITGTATITVINLPTASISGSTTICAGNTSNITFNGTPNAIVTYNNGTSIQTINLDSTGTATFTTPVLNTTTTYNLVSVALTGTNNCTQNLVGNVVINVIPLPTATILGSITICNGNTANITFNGTPNSTITYKINNGTNQTIILDATGNASLTTSALNTNTIYNLISVNSNTTPNCINNVTGNATLTVLPSPTVSISGTNNVCSGSTANINFSGTPNTIVTFSNGTTNQTITLNNTGNGIFTTPSLTANTTFSLISVGYPNTPSCLQNVVGTAVITITNLPTATISGTNTICAGNISNISFNGTPNAIVTYNVNGGTNQTITLDTSGNAILTSPVLNSNTTYNLISVNYSTGQNCVNNLSQNVIITVKPIPTASISGTKTICSGNATTINFIGTPDTIVTFSNGTSNQTITLDNSGNGVFNTPLLNADTTYSLVNVGHSGTPNCSQNLAGNAIITVLNSPTASILGSTSICAGNTSIITFSGTPNATVTFNNGVSNININLDSTGNATFTTPTLNSTTVYSLVSVTLIGFNNCVQNLNEIATIQVFQLPTATIADGILCLEKNGTPLNTYILNTGYTGTNYNFEWYFQGNLINLPITQYFYIATQIGIYGVKIKNTFTGCESNILPINVTGITKAQSIEIIQSEIFSDNNDVTVNVTGGTGILQYQLDNGPLQSFNLFTNVLPGSHTITVTDKEGCTNLIKTFEIINYPKFFTPNGDSYNDTWKIIGLNKSYQAKINIFDRFGKILYSFNPPADGWDGNYKGKPSTATDYWFTIDYVEKGVNKFFKSHFSLKR